MLLRISPRRLSLWTGVVLLIAITIAITSALFSVVDGFLLRPLPFAEPENIVVLGYRSTEGQLPPLAYDPALTAEREALLLRIERSALVVGSTNATPNTSFGARARDLGLEVTDVDSEFFPLLGVHPERGRLFTPEDELSDSSPLPIPVVVGHSVWRTLDGGTEGAFGVRELAGQKVRIVGVIPNGIKFPGETNVWALMKRTRVRPPTYARLGQGITPDQVMSVAPELTATRLPEALRPDRTGAVLLLFAAAGVLTLVAWVQIAALVMAGAGMRMREVGVRLCLGASRLRILGHFAAENAVMAGAASILACIAVRPLTAFIVSTLPQALVRGQYLDPDIRTLLFANVVTFAGFGVLMLFPFAVIHRTPPVFLLQGRLSRVPFRPERFRQGLLVAQVTLTTVILYLSGLTIHSFAQAAGFDYGFDSQRVVLFRPPFPAAGAVQGLAGGGDVAEHDFEARSKEKRRRVALTLERLEHTPNVVAAAGFFVVPLVEPGNFAGWEELKTIDGREVAPSRLLVNSVSPGFIRALGATLIQGSDFEQPDLTGSKDIAIVNETFVRQFVPRVEQGEHPIQISPVGMLFATDQSRGRIVGVLRDLVYSKVTDPPIPQAFFPSYDGGAARVLAIRTGSSVDQALPAIRNALEPIWGPLPPERFSALRDAWRAGLKPFSGQAELLTIIAGTAVLLAVIGLAGFLMYSVRLRSRELAIRAALGASPSFLRRYVVNRALLVVSLGLLAGTLAGVAAGRLIAAQLFMVQAADPATILTVMVLLLTVAWLSALVPAHAAARTAPAVALRDE